MFATRRIFHRLIFWVVLIGVNPQCCPQTRAQIPRGCGGSEYIGAVSNKPFTAEYVAIDKMPVPDGLTKTAVSRQSAARDRKGRIRLVKRPPEGWPEYQKTVMVQTPEGTTFFVKQEEASTTIEIVDCESGKGVTIYPGLRFATVTESRDPAPPKRRRYAYSRGFIPRPGEKTQSDAIIEVLGRRKIQGVRVVGVRWTRLGTEMAGEWKGEPITQDEFWVSDDLSVQLLRINKDFQRGSESQLELTAIKRGEPDPALFEIPKDFTVNPVPGHGPFIRDVPMHIQ